jgi:hypothetical protein
MTTRHRLALLFCAALAPLSAVGCATTTPEPLVRLVPNGPHTAWLSGRPVVAREEAGIRVAIAFDQQVEDTLGMRVEVQNDSADAADVSPRRVTFSTCTTTAQKETCSNAQAVLDPEEVLTDLEAERSRERAQAANDHEAMTPLLILSAVGDVAGVAGGVVAGDGGDVAGQMERDQARHQGAVATLDSEHERWSTAALRRTTLFPGHGIAGYVYLPTDLHASRVWLMVRVGDHRFSFGFDQTLIPVS